MIKCRHPLKLESAVRFLVLLAGVAVLFVIAGPVLVLPAVAGDADACTKGTGDGGDRDSAIADLDQASANRVILDAAEAAREVYSTASHPSDLGELIDKWDIRIRPSYAKMIMMHPGIAEIISKKPIIDGLFIGIGRSNRMALAQAELTYTTDGQINTHLNYHEPAGNGIAIFHGGHLEIIEELDRGTTERARAKIAQMKARQAKASGVDVLADKSSMAVKAVMDWSNDPTIGGDVASIIIERGKKWRWFSRPTFCTKN
jgi:hypothetical protein